jgi:uncharacterized protein YndB with AHSA1/START domain
MDARGEQTAFVYTTYIRETPERVWQGLTDPALMKRYWRHQKAGPKTFHSDWKRVPPTRWRTTKSDWP